MKLKKEAGAKLRHLKENLEPKNFETTKYHNDLHQNLTLKYDFKSLLYTQALHI